MAAICLSRRECDPARLPSQAMRPRGRPTLIRGLQALAVACLLMLTACGAAVGEEPVRIVQPARDQCHSLVVPPAPAPRSLFTHCFSCQQLACLYLLQLLLQSSCSCGRGGAAAAGAAQRLRQRQQRRRPRRRQRRRQQEERQQEFRREQALLSPA